MHLHSLGKRGVNYCSHQFLNWWQELFTGQFHINGFESYIYIVHQKEKPHRMVWFLLAKVQYNGAESEVRKAKRCVRLCRNDLVFFVDGTFKFFVYIVVTICIPGN